MCKAIVPAILTRCQLEFSITDKVKVPLWDSMLSEMGYESATVFGRVVRGLQQFNRYIYTVFPAARAALRSTLPEMMNQGNGDAQKAKLN